MLIDCALRQCQGTHASILASVLKELALEVSTDPDHKFELAIGLDDLDTALQLARASPHLGSQSKWRAVGDRALASWKIGLAEECFKMANDLSALLLIYTSTGDREGLKSLSATAGESPDQSSADPVAYADQD